ncbi:MULTISPECIES: type VI secretion system-associated protein TagF [unclassified Pseudoalteromonas]|uniref:type VI secretion system-associated protein TagF n=1 Tax=unclassified Pseudoalteromonas TaxID=194690 RepID=UPI001F3682A8|nr:MULTISPECIES: type VI secretion system-associated protein TagF [unclassified Pseudoalteromonas]MCF2827839.1 type VI secretion system-associated protein TagF [Pseudoalteromonas sp. OF5H-5]MCF2833886.1 type VI secretion system-associated protein TagF [Pseudoalteromonas sp. DL2-H6]MCF2925949.1 type VI secretion system-associated protein TagF [Pseudoalteromonas sp. DL2-H1]MCG7553769.1 type VI secretion system-associated protein TagF [Pseudoalteromonas sp. Of11M-6]
MFGFFNNKKVAKVPTTQPFGFMGKNPIQADFIKFNVDSREAITLERWLQEGYADMSRQALIKDVSSQKEQSTLFFIASGQDENCLLGTLQPSEDKSGRQYPFCSFVLSSNADYKQNPAFLFSECGSAFKSLSLSHELIRNCSSVEQMRHSAQELKQVSELVSQPIDFDKAMSSLRASPIQRVWDALELEDLDQRAQLISQVMSALKMIKTQGCLRCQFGLKLPMPQVGEDTQLLGAFWLHLITNMVADHHWQPWCFYNYGQLSQKASLVVYCRPMPASYFASVWLEHNSLSTTINLTGTLPQHPVTPHMYELAKASNMSVFDALRSWSKL